MKIIYENIVIFNSTQYSKLLIINITGILLISVLSSGFLAITKLDYFIYLIPYLPRIEITTTTSQIYLIVFLSASLES